MNRRHTYLIVEDEPILADKLARQLATSWPEATCCGIAENGDHALVQIEARRPDVVFLDVRMPRRDGLETARELSTRQHVPLVVFITAYDQYAVDAFSAAAVDYLLKPVDEERLALCIARLRQRLTTDHVALAAQMTERIEALLQQRFGNPARLRFIRAGAGQTVKLIAVDDVLWFESADKYVTVATAAGDSVIRTPLRELRQQLDPEVFWQVHRGSIVNSHYIVTARRHDDGRIELVMRGRPETVDVSRQFAHLFQQM